MGQIAIQDGPGRGPAFLSDSVLSSATASSTCTTAANPAVCGGISPQDTVCTGLISNFLPSVEYPAIIPTTQVKGAALWSYFNVLGGGLANCLAANGPIQFVMYINNGTTLTRHVLATICTAPAQNTVINTQFSTGLFNITPPLDRISFAMEVPLATNSGISTVDSYAIQEVTVLLSLN